MMKRKFLITISMGALVTIQFLNFTLLKQSNAADDFFSLAEAQSDFPEDPEHNQVTYADPDCDGECTRFTFKSEDYYGRGDGGYGPYDKWCSTSTSGSGGSSGGSVGSDGYWVDGCGWSEYNPSDGSCWDESC